MNIDFIPHLLYTKNSLLHTLNIASRLGKNLPANARNMGSVPGSGRSSGGGNGNPLHYSCLGNTMDKGALQATWPTHGVTKSWT